MVRGEPIDECRAQSAECRSRRAADTSALGTLQSTLGILFVVLLSTCSGQSRAEPAVDTTSVAGVIDSLLPIEEEIRRFRIDVPEVPANLEGGERSRDALVEGWVKAVESRDAVALSRMLMSAAEYITFYYPESPYTRPPYRQKPALRWFLITNSSSQGASRVWQRHAGSPLGFAGYGCAAQPEVLGNNRIWHGCVLRLRPNSGERQLRLFGPIVERNGRFKFLSYAADY